MKPGWFGVTTLIFIVAVISGQPTNAEWSHDPTENNPVCTAPGYQEGQQIVSDGAGGAIIVWHDYRSGNWDIYAQRVNASGNMLWTIDGEPICTATGTQSTPRLVSDEASGAIVVWSDRRSGDIHVYAQRVDESGNLLWAADGMAVCTAAVSKAGPQLVNDGSGGAIITWSDLRTGDWNIYAQRVDGSGNMLWAGNGEPVCAASEAQSNPNIVSDEVGGVIIVWDDNRDGEYDIFAQRVDATGNMLWTGNGEAVCTAKSNQHSPKLVSDEAGGAIIVWIHSYNWVMSGRIYCQRVNGSGNMLWTVDGELITTESAETVHLVDDGENGAIIVWSRDNHSQLMSLYSHIVAQRVNAKGTTQWPEPGVIISDVGDARENSHHLVGDGAGGAVITWYDYLNPEYEGNIYAQRIDSSGNHLWTQWREPVCTAEDHQRYPQLINDGSGGAIIAWRDDRSGGGEQNIYAQRIDCHGYLDASPLITEVIDKPEDQGGIVVLNWQSSFLDVSPNIFVTHYTIWMRPTGSEWLHVEDVSASYQDEYFMDAPTIGVYTGSGEIPWTDYMVTAHTADELVYWQSVVATGYSIDNLAPGSPLNLTGFPSDTNVHLNWVASGIHDEDLALYKIYRSTEIGFTPETSLLIDVTSETIYTDLSPANGTWYYLVTAEDIHNNEGLPSNEVAVTIGLPSTVAAMMTCQPSSGTLPFNTHFSLSMMNTYTEQVRRLQYRIDVTLANSQHFSNWRRGWKNVMAEEYHTKSWWQMLPALAPLSGYNCFHLIVADVTPAPYNLPPYPPAGSIATDSCTIEGVNPSSLL